MKTTAGKLFWPQITGYELLEKVGVGAHSAVYRAREQESGLIKAIKYLKRTSREDDKYIRHLFNEYETLLKVQHPGPKGRPYPSIVQPEVLEKERSLFKLKAAYMVMEYIPGYTLGEKSDYPLAELLDLFVQIGRALEHIHRRGVVHGDMKPENVIVRPDRVIKVIDFGFSCPRHTMLRSIKGTRGYLAPEQVKGGLITELTDLYNFGATMYKVLTGKPVRRLIPQFDGRGQTFIDATANVKPTPVRELRPEVPEALSNVVMQCCELDPGKRPSNMSVVLDELERQLFVL